MLLMLSTTPTLKKNPGRCARKIYPPLPNHMSWTGAMRGVKNSTYRQHPQEAPSVEGQMVNGPAQGLPKTVLAGTMAIGDTAHPIEGPRELTGHEAIMIADPPHHQGSAGRTGVVATGQTSLCLLHMGRATVKVVTVVDTAIEIEQRLAMSTFLPTKVPDPERNVGHGIPTIDRLAEMVDVGPETLATQETVFPKIVRSGAEATETGTEGATRAALEETGEMGERAHEVPSEETGHASEIETFTGDRIACTSHAWGPFEWESVFRLYQQEEVSCWDSAHAVWLDGFLYNMHGVSGAT